MVVVNLLGQVRGTEAQHDEDQGNEVEENGKGGQADDGDPGTWCGGFGVVLGGFVVVLGGFGGFWGVLVVVLKVFSGGFGGV